MDRLLAAILSGAHGGLRYLWRYARRNPRMRAILYRAWNRGVFGNNFEHELMLADQVRVDAYHEAIKRHINEDDVVVDLGTGTGLLAFFASQRGAKRVYAIDHSDIISLAECMAAHNGLKNISFTKIHNKDFTIPEKINVILHEQLGNFLVEEDIISNVCDLRDRLLAPHGRIIPDKFDIFLEPLCLKDERRVAFLWEHQLYGVRYDILKDRLRSRGAATTIRSRFKLGADDAAYFLCDPTEVLSIDLRTATPDSVPKRLRFRKVVVRAGEMDGFCMYFRIRFDDELCIDNGPFSKHMGWDCYIFRTERVRLDMGDLLDVEWEIGEHTDVDTWRVSYRVAPKASSSSAAE